MLVLTPVSPAQIASALALVALSTLAFVMLRPFRTTLRVSRLLAPVPGPKGRFLLGFAPELAANLHRIHDFQVPQPSIFTE